MLDAKVSHDPVKPQLVAKMSNEYPDDDVGIMGVENVCSDESKSPVAAAAEVVMNDLRFTSITK